MFTPSTGFTLKRKHLIAPAPSQPESDRATFARSPAKAEGGGENYHRKKIILG